MSQHVLDTASQAIFQLQLNTNDAIRYVVKEAGISPKEAGLALKEVMVGYRSR